MVEEYLGGLRIFDTWKMQTWKKWNSKASLQVVAIF